MQLLKHKTHKTECTTDPFNVDMETNRRETTPKRKKNVIILGHSDITVK